MRHDLKLGRVRRKITPMRKSGFIARDEILCLCNTWVARCHQFHSMDHDLGVKQNEGALARIRLAAKAEFTQRSVR